MAKARILCVDDDRATISILAAILKKEGYEVDTALDGKEGLKKAREFKPDLLVLDVMMPEMDGFQVCRQLQREGNTSKIAVLMLTAKGGVDEPTEQAWQFATKVRDRLAGFDSGALEFLTKPVKAKELVQRVKAILWMTGAGA